jgi:phage shock protein C
MTEPLKLAKNLEKRMLSGVCAGIADYFNIDPNLVRVIAVILSFFTGGAAVLAYIVAAFILPVREEDKGIKRRYLLNFMFFIILSGAVLTFLMI